MKDHPVITEWKRGFPGKTVPTKSDGSYDLEQIGVDLGYSDIVDRIKNAPPPPQWVTPKKGCVVEIKAVHSTEGMESITTPKVVPDDCWFCGEQMELDDEYIDVIWVRPTTRDEVVHRMCIICGTRTDGPGLNPIVEQDVLDELKELRK